MDDFSSMLERLAHEARMRQFEWFLAEIVVLALVWWLLFGRPVQEAKSVKKSRQNFARKLRQAYGDVLASAMVYLMFGVYALDILCAKLAVRRRGVRKQQ